MLDFELLELHTSLSRAGVSLRSKHHVIIVPDVIFDMLLTALFCLNIAVSGILRCAEISKIVKPKLINGEWRGGTQFLSVKSACCRHAHTNINLLLQPSNHLSGL